MEWKDKDLNLGILPEDIALGVNWKHWNIQEDTLGFIIKMDEKLTTWFQAALRSIYNSLGLGAPFLLKGRLIIQSLC